MSDLIDFSIIPKDQAGRKLATFLRKTGFMTISQIIKLEENELLQFKNFGKKQLEYLKEYLKEEGYELKQETPKEKTYKSFEIWLKNTLPETFDYCYEQYKRYRKINAA